MDTYVDQVVVVETDTQYLYVGRLGGADDSHYLLRDVAVYDAATARISEDRFLVECAAHGRAVARRELRVLARRVVSIGRLDDVVRPGRGQ